MDYADLRLLHMSFAGLSFAGFVTRGVLLWRKSPSCQRRLFRILPHVNDSLLLIAGIALVIQSGQYPWQQPWLATKLCALLIYIGLGSLALRPRRPLRIRVIAFFLALLTFGWLVSIALTRHPLGFCALFAG